MKRKAQMQMMETIAVLFVFFILIAFGFIFYANFMKSSVQVKKAEQFELKAVELAEVVSSLPELHCSEENIEESNCIDLLKLDGASDVMQSNLLLYFDILGYSNITIEVIYPEPDTYYIYSNVPREYQNKLPNFVPISLKNPITRGYGFGVMSIVLYTT